MEKKKDTIPTARKLPTTNRQIIQSFLITTARYEFDIHEKRILSNLIGIMQDKLQGRKLRGRIEKDLFDDYHVEISLSELIPDFDRSNSRHYKNALISLRNRMFEYEDEDVWRPIGIIERPQIRKKGGIISFDIAKQLVDVFLDFSKGYSKYTLGVSLELKSIYSMRFYELLSNNKISLTYRIDRLKEILNVADKYPDNSNFINRCIKPAKKELDGVANWSFDYTPIKRGKKYELIKFTPIHHPEREDASIQEAEAKRRVHLSWFVERDVRHFLLNVCHFTDKEIKGGKNLATIQLFQKKYGSESVNKMNEIWNRAIQKNDPKRYFMGTLKLETES